MRVGDYTPFKVLRAISSPHSTSNMHWYGVRGAHRSYLGQAIYFTRSEFIIKIAEKTKETSVSDNFMNYANFLFKKIVFIIIDVSLVVLKIFNKSTRN